ncbi:5'-methylthioadenosine phosphorylase [bacterium]|nr:5'-methylthioadenosine phosphorylase [bacterium]
MLVSRPAVILGSSFTYGVLADLQLRSVIVQTRWGPACLHQSELGWVLFRHGPEHWLPHQIPFRAQAAALATAGCDRLLVTSSVGVLDSSLPLFSPLLVRDLVMLENRLPDGSICSMYPVPSAGQGHLVLEEGLFSRQLNGELNLYADRALPEVVFAFVPGPRTKTSHENRLLSLSGIQVNSMSLGPEVVLANELEIPTAGLVVGHKYSGGPDRHSEIHASLNSARQALEPLILRFLRERGPAPAFANRIHRF